MLRIYGILLDEDKGEKWCLMVSFALFIFGGLGRIVPQRIFLSHGFVECDTYGKYENLII